MEHFIDVNEPHRGSIICDSETYQRLVDNAGHFQDLWKVNYLKRHPNIVKSSIKIGRNDPCLCGSGKKHKKCCGVI